MSVHFEVGKNIGRFFAKATKYVSFFPHVAIGISLGAEDESIQDIYENLCTGLEEYTSVIEVGTISQNVLERYLQEANIQAGVYLYIEGANAVIEVYTHEGQVKNQELSDILTGNYAWSHSLHHSPKSPVSRLSAKAQKAYAEATSSNLLSDPNFPDDYDHNICVASSATHVLDTCQAVASKVGAVIKTLVLSASDAYQHAINNNEHTFYINQHGTKLLLFTPSGTVQKQENLILATLLSVVQKSNSSQLQENESLIPVDNVCLSIDTSKFLWDTLFTFFDTSVSVSNDCVNSLKLKAYIEKSLAWANNSCMFGFKNNDYLPDAIYAMFMLSPTHTYIEETIEILPSAKKAMFRINAPEFIIETMISEVKAKLPHHNTYMDGNGEMICDDEWSLRYYVQDSNVKDKDITFEIFSENPNFIVHVQNQLVKLQNKYS